MPEPLFLSGTQFAMNDTSYAVGLQTGRLRSIMVRCACGSLVRSLSFSQKNLISSALPEAKFPFG